VKYFDEYACLSVVRITRKPHDRTSSISVHVAYTVLARFLLRMRCDTLCTSGFVDDVTFSHINVMCIPKQP